jgi:predicted RNA binding protein YcfA (HicA-like mRNA interferase family)
MKVRDVLRRLAADGWMQVKTGGGSHRPLIHPVKPGRVTVAFHRDNADVPIGTLKNIFKQAGLE